MNFIYIINLLFLFCLLHCRKYIVRSSTLTCGWEHLNWDMCKSRQAESHKSSLCRKTYIETLKLPSIFLSVCLFSSLLLSSSDSPASPVLGSFLPVPRMRAPLWAGWRSLNYSCHESVVLLCYCTRQKIKPLFCC